MALIALQAACHTGSLERRHGLRGWRAANLNEPPASEPSPFQLWLELTLARSSQTASSPSEPFEPGPAARREEPQPRVKAEAGDRTSDPPRQRKDALPRQRPETESFGGSRSGSRDQSAASLRERANPRHRVAPAGPVVPPPRLASSASRKTKARLPGLADGRTISPGPADLHIIDLIGGSFRVQVLEASENRLVLDKIYALTDKIEIAKDVEQEPGFNWIRIAYVDLLDFQHPFTDFAPVQLRPEHGQVICPGSGPRAPCATIWWLLPDRLDERERDTVLVFAPL